MTRLLALCTGATVGLAVGWLWGSNTSRLVEAHALAAGAVRPREARTAPPASSEPLEPGNGAQEGTWPPDQAALHARPDYQEALRRAEDMPWNDAADLVEWLAARGLTLPTQRDGLAEWEREIAKPAAPPRPCTVRSPGGGIVCCRTGDHSSHLFPGSHARDRKADADERIE